MRHARYLIAAAALVAFPLLTGNEFHVRVAQDTAYLAIAAIGLNLLFGLSGQLSLGQAGFFALGAYGSGIAATRYGWPLPVSITVGLLIAGMAGVVMGLIALRARSHYLAMATLAFGFIIEILSQRWSAFTGGSMGLVGVPQLNFGDFGRGPTYFFWLVAGTLLIVQMVSDFIMKSHHGRVLRALSASESFAVTVGIDAPRWRAGVFVGAALLSGLSGIFFAHQSGYVSSDAFGPERSVELLIAVVIGGLGNPYGAVVGSVIVVLLNQLIAGLHEVAFFIFGGILMAVMLFFPAGAAGGIERLFRRARRAPSREVEGVATPVVLEQRQPQGEGPLLRLRNLDKAYAGVHALRAVSLEILPGTIHALIGPNGAGKSTAINVIAGLYEPTTGGIEFRGHDITRAAAWKRARLGMARTFQNLQLIGTLTVCENVMLGLRDPTPGLARGFLGWLGSNRSEARARGAALSVLASVGIERFADELPGSLSYGHRKLCELARALAQDPVLILLDEPIAGLNSEEAKDIGAAIMRLRDRGLTILVVEHNMRFVMGVSDRITVLDYGKKIGEGTPEQVQRDPAVIAAYLGTEVARDQSA